jgi:hypothetical protein
VKFHADICYPHVGQIFKAPVAYRSKIGIHAELKPIKVLIPRDLHIGEGEFEAITEKDEIVFEVLGAEFKQNDDSIFVLGKLIQRVGSGGITKSDEEVVSEAPPPPPPTSNGDGGDVKTVAIKDLSSTQVSEEKKATRRKKRLGPATNDPSESLTLDI